MRLIQIIALTSRGSE